MSETDTKTELPDPVELGGEEQQATAKMPSGAGVQLTLRPFVHRSIYETLRAVSRETGEGIDDMVARVLYEACGFQYGKPSQR